MRNRLILGLLVVAASISMASRRAPIKSVQKEAAISVTYDNAQHELIKAYVKKNKIKGEFTKSGLFVSAAKKKKKGAYPTLSSTVKANYKGYLLTGEVFDDSKGTAIEFPLSMVIKGWQEGIPYLAKGGKGVLVIPSELAYGESSPSPAIPANSVLVFEVELVDFK